VRHLVIKVLKIFKHYCEFRLRFPLTEIDLRERLVL